MQGFSDEGILSSLNKLERAVVLKTKAEAAQSLPQVETVATRLARSERRCFSHQVALDGAFLTKHTQQVREPKSRSQPSDLRVYLIMRCNVRPSVQLRAAAHL
jgi:hypothetical protein